MPRVVSPLYKKHWSNQIYHYIYIIPYYIITVKEGKTSTMLSFQTQKKLNLYALWEDEIANLCFHYLIYPMLTTIFQGMLHEQAAQTTTSKLLWIPNENLLVNKRKRSHSHLNSSLYPVMNWVEWMNESINRIKFLVSVCDVRIPFIFYLRGRE